MTNDEMLKGLLESEPVRQSILVMSAFGELKQEQVALAIPDYFKLCSVITARLVEMKVHELCPMGPDNANVPFIVLGQVGAMRGGADDMVLHLCAEEGVEAGQLDEFVKNKIETGDRGEANLYHGIMVADCVGSYLEQLKTVQMLLAIEEGMAPQVNLDDVPDIFAGKVH